MATIQVNTGVDPPKLQTHTSTTRLMDESNDYDELPPVSLNKTSPSDTLR